MMTKLRWFLSTLGLILLLPRTVSPVQGQGPGEGWQVYTNGNYVNALGLEGGGALGGGYTWVGTEGGVVCHIASEQVTFTILGGTSFDKTDDTWVTFSESDGLATNSV